jgi:hypothetical protein
VDRLAADSAAACPRHGGLGTASVEGVGGRHEEVDGESGAENTDATIPEPAVRTTPEAMIAGKNSR